MKDWPDKGRDLAIAYRIMTDMASQNQGRLGFLDTYQSDEKTATVRFTLSAWVGVLIRTFSMLYPEDALADILSNVLEEILTPLGVMGQEDINLFQALVRLALTEQRPTKTLHKIYAGYAVEF